MNLSAFFIANLAYLTIAFAFIISTNNDPEYCDNESCKTFVTNLFKSMNRSVNPCDDFYEFTCGNYSNNFPIPDSLPYQTVVERVEELQELQMKEIMENIDINNRNQSSSIRLMANIYHNCMNNETDQLQEYLYEEFKQNWLIGHDSIPKDNNISWNERYVRFVTKTNSYPIFMFSIEANEYNVSQYLPTLYPSLLVLSEEDFTSNNNSQLLSAYRAYIYDTARLFCSTCDENKLNNDINDLIEFETSLARIKLQTLPDHYSVDNVSDYRIEQFQAITNFEWNRKIFNEIISKTLSNDNIIFTHDDIINVYSGQFFTKLIALLQQTDPQIFENYMYWFYISENMRSNTNRSREIYFHFNKVYMEIIKQEEKWKSCQAYVKKHFIWSMSRAWIDKYFTNNENNHANKMVKVLKDSFKNILTNSQWLDVETRTEALKKIDSLATNVAYPEWLLDNSKLDTFYGLTDQRIVDELFQQKNHFIVCSYIRKYRASQDFARADKYYNEAHQIWPYPPFVVNAAYSANQNSITIPAGLLKAPLFNIDYPSSINYGNTGCTIGHELVHAFDNEGKNFDQYGNYNVQTWTNHSIEQFKKKAHCFVRQYNNIIEPRTQLNIDGLKALNENIADNGALNDAYYGYMRMRKHSEKSADIKIRDLNDYTDEQLFFISYGYSWCSNTRLTALRTQIVHGRYPPEKYRVNIPVSNSNDFARVFNCPIDSPMNPSEKCILW